MRSRLFGTALIIAGTIIGAGMLALPLSTLSTGLYPTFGFLVGSWVLMMAAAFLGFDLIRWHGGDVTFHSIAIKAFGPWGGSVITILLLALPYTLLSAYTAGATGFLKSFAPALPDWSLAALFLILFGGLCITNTRTVDHANRLLFIVKIVLFILVILVVTPHLEGALLTQVASHIPFSFWTSLPVFVSAFGFHASLPSLVHYMGPQHVKTFRLAILIGMTIPFAAYLLWLIVIFGLTGIGGATSLPDLIAIIKLKSSTNWIPPTLDVFAFLALLTSFLGVTLGLITTLEDVLVRQKPSKFLVGILSFLPPLLVFIFIPALFVKAIAFAGLVLVLLAVLFPAIAVLKLNPSRLSPLYRMGCYILIGCSCLIMMLEICNIF